MFHRTRKHQGKWLNRALGSRREIWIQSQVRSSHVYLCCFMPHQCTFRVFWFKWGFCSISNFWLKMLSLKIWHVGFYQFSLICCVLYNICQWGCMSAWGTCHGWGWLGNWSPHHGALGSSWGYQAGNLICPCHADFLSACFISTCRLEF